MHDVKTYQKEVQLYREQYGGRHFTKEELEKIEGMLEWLKTHPYDARISLQTPTSPCQIGR